MPVLCNYYVTYRCNAACGFCDIWEQPSPLIDLGDAARNLDDLRRLGVRVIDFTGGEPLLHPQIGTLLAMAKGRGFLTSLTTNGLLYPKRAREMAGKVDLLHFSIDSSRRAEHDASRRVRCYDKLLESIAVALEIGERPDLLFTVTNDNAHRLAEIYDHLSYPNRLQLLVNPLFEYHAHGGHLADDVMAQVRAFARKPYVYLNPAFLTLRQKGGNDPAAPDCKAVSTTIVLSPFNEVILPCYHAGLEKLPVEGRLYDLWTTHPRVAWHRQMEGRHAVCQGCAINCYFEPSFATRPASPYFWESLPSKLRYSWTKFVVQRLAAKFGGPQHAHLPAFDDDDDRPTPGDGLPAQAEPLLALPVLRMR